MNTNPWRDKSHARNAASRLGCHCWGSNATSVALLPAAAQAGCRWVRATRPMQMDYVLVSPGVYDFAGRGEASVNAARAAGMSVLGLLDARWGNETGTNTLGFCSPVWEHLDAWADFVRQAVAFYRGRVSHWEVLNEPPFFWWNPTPPGQRMPAQNPPLRRAPIAAYARLLQVTAATIRSTDPQARIVAGSGFADGAFLARLYELGCRDAFDIASVHYLDCTHPDGFARGLRRLRTVMSRFGDGAKPIWDTENGPHGAVIGHGLEARRAFEANYGIYRHCFAHEHGLERYFWFNTADDVAGMTPESLATVADTHPAYRALATLHRLVGDGPLLGVAHWHDEVHAYVFEGTQGAISILWSTAPADVAFISAPDAIALDGTPLSRATPPAISPQPVFIRGDIRARVRTVRVTGPRMVRHPVFPGKEVRAETPRLSSVCVAHAPGIGDPAWAHLPWLGRRSEVRLPPQLDHFCAVSSSVFAEIQIAHDADALYLRARTFDDRFDSRRPYGLVQLALRDSDPAVNDWPPYHNGYALLNLYAGPHGPQVLRFDARHPDDYPPGRVAEATLACHPQADGLLLWARLPWAALGPCRPGHHNPFHLQLTFNRADGLLDVPEADDPAEWPQNFCDTFIVKEPALARWVEFH